MSQANRASGSDRLLLKMQMLHETTGWSSANYLKRISALGLRHHGLETQPPIQPHNQLRRCVVQPKTFEINAL